MEGDQLNVSILVSLEEQFLEIRDLIGPAMARLIEDKLQYLKDNRTTLSMVEAKPLIDELKELLAKALTRVAEPESKDEKFTADVVGTKLAQARKSEQDRFDVEKQLNNIGNLAYIPAEITLFSSDKEAKEEARVERIAEKDAARAEQRRTRERVLLESVISDTYDWNIFLKLLRVKSPLYYFMTVQFFENYKAAVSKVNEQISGCRDQAKDPKNLDKYNELILEQPTINPVVEVMTYGELNDPEDLSFRAAAPEALKAALQEAVKYENVRLIIRYADTMVAQAERLLTDPPDSAVKHARWINTFLKRLETAAFKEFWNSAEELIKLPKLEEAGLLKARGLKKKIEDHAAKLNTLLVDIREKIKRENRSLEEKIADIENRLNAPDLTPEEKQEIIGEKLALAEIKDKIHDEGEALDKVRRQIIQDADSKAGELKVDSDLSEEDLVNASLYDFYLDLLFSSGGKAKFAKLFPGDYDIGIGIILDAIRAVDAIARSQSVSTIKGEFKKLMSKKKESNKLTDYVSERVSSELSRILCRTQPSYSKSYWKYIQPLIQDGVYESIDDSGACEFIKSYVNLRKQKAIYAFHMRTIVEEANKLDFTDCSFDKLIEFLDGRKDDHPYISHIREFVEVYKSIQLGSIPEEIFPARFTRHRASIEVMMRDPNFFNNIGLNPFIGLGSYKNPDDIDRRYLSLSVVPSKFLTQEIIESNTILVYLWYYFEETSRLIFNDDVLGYFGNCFRKVLNAHAYNLDLIYKSYFANTDFQSSFSNEIDFKNDHTHLYTYNKQVREFLGAAARVDFNEADFSAPDYNIEQMYYDTVLIVGKTLQKYSSILDLILYDSPQISLALLEYVIKCGKQPADTNFRDAIVKRQTNLSTRYFMDQDDSSEKYQEFNIAKYSLAKQAYWSSIREKPILNSPVAWMEFMRFCIEYYVSIDKTIPQDHLQCQKFIDIISNDADVIALIADPQNVRQSAERIAAKYSPKDIVFALLEARPKDPFLKVCERQLNYSAKLQALTADPPGTEFTRYPAFAGGMDIKSIDRITRTHQLRKFFQDHGAARRYPSKIFHYPLALIMYDFNKTFTIPSAKELQSYKLQSRLFKNSDTDLTKELMRDVILQEVLHGGKGTKLFASLHKHISAIDPKIDSSLRAAFVSRVNEAKRGDVDEYIEPFVKTAFDIPAVVGGATFNMGWIVAVLVALITILITLAVLVFRSGSDEFRPA